MADNLPISNGGHPLCNPVVASTLFEVVDLAQMSTLRLVCKEWHSASLPIWRKNVQINIYTDSYYSERPRMWKVLGKELDVAGEQPFRNFRLHSPPFLADNSKPLRNMERFWANYGHWIHKLELKDVAVADVAAFKRAIFERTPNLQELIFDRLKDGRGRDAGDAGIPLKEGEGQPQPNLNLKAFAMRSYCELPFGWKLLFDHFPNILKLEISRKPASVDEFVECLEEMLRNPARRPNLPITDLRFKEFEASTVEMILRMPLGKLKVLHAAGKLEIFQTAMQHHGNTLEELHLQNEYDSMDYWESQMGTFPTLTELEMKGSAYAYNFHFLNKLPNLKVLRLEQLDEEEMLKNTNWGLLERMSHLREFYFIVTDSDSWDADALQPLSEEVLERFGGIMPNLDSFTGQLTNLTLRVVCRNWRKLRKLVILSGKDYEGMSETPLAGIMDIDDVGITGIVHGSDERLPCVADLQELRHLTLEHVTDIGNESVFDGFLKLQHLSSLDICAANLISRNALNSLKERLQGGLTITSMFWHGMR